MIYLVNECHHASDDAICPVDVLTLAEVTAKERRRISGDAYFSSEFPEPS